MNIIVPVLVDIFEGKYKFKITQIEEILLDSDTFREIQELRVFLNGLKWALMDLSAFDLTNEVY
jgi:hypothetical protein